MTTDAQAQTAAADDTPGIGHNVPDPAAVLQDELANRHADLTGRRDELLEAVERVPETIDDEDAAQRCTDFIKQLDACLKNTKAARVAEKEPYLNGGRLVDGWFAKISEPIDKAKAGLASRYTAFLRKKEEAERRAREEEERKARQEAERARREAEEAAAKAQNEVELDQAIAADEAARAAEAEAAKAEKQAGAKAADLSRTRGDYGAVGSLRTVWTFKDLDRGKLDLEALRAHLPSDALEKAVRSFIKAGGRELAGVEIYEDRTAVVR